VTARARRPLALTGAVAALALPVHATATDVTALMAAVAAQARFAEPAVATGTLVSRTGDGAETRLDVRLAGRRGTVRIDAGAIRALTRRGRSVVRDGTAPARLTLTAVLPGTNVDVGDLGVFTSRLLDLPQIVDQEPAAMVVASAPAPASPYALLVYTIDPARRRGESELTLT
jgi:hypothetical protein